MLSLLFVLLAVSPVPFTEGFTTYTPPVFLHSTSRSSQMYAKEISISTSAASTFRKTTELSMSSMTAPNSNKHNFVSSSFTKISMFYEKYIRHNQMTPEVTPAIRFFRKVALIFVTACVVFQSKINIGLSRLWFFLQNNSTHWLARCFRHDHWEWMLAVSAFFVYIHIFWLVDKYMIHTAKKGIRHPWRKYRLQDQHAIEQHLQKLNRSNKHNSHVEAETLPMPIPEKWHSGAWLFEVPLYIVPLYIWDIMIPRRAIRIGMIGAPTLSRVVRDVLGGLLLYDFVFYFAHLMMHKVPLFYKWFHRKHHTAKEVRACDQVRLSGVEEFIDVGISIWALRALGTHPISRTIYNLIITFLLTELHCGYDFPWSLQNVVPFGLVNGSRGHHYHHRSGKHYYQKFFCHLDRLFNHVDKRIEIK